MLVAALVTSVFLASSGAASEEFPTGKYGLASLRGEANQTQYDPDGTWNLMTGDKQISSATHSVYGDKFTCETDRWCRDVLQVEEPGISTWSFQDDTLTLEAVDSDPCPSRDATFDGKAQTKVP